MSLVLQRKGSTSKVELWELGSSVVWRCHLLGGWLYYIFGLFIYGLVLHTFGQYFTFVLECHHPNEGEI